MWVSSCPQILLDVRPLEDVAGFFKMPLEFLAQHQCQKTAEDMPPNCIVALMEDGPCFQHGLHTPEHPLHLPQFLVLEGHLRGGQVRVGARIFLRIDSTSSHLLPLLPAVRERGPGGGPQVLKYSPAFGTFLEDISLLIGFPVDVGV